jgi:glutathione S-transferase
LEITVIELWELRGEKNCRYSTFAWRTRLALLHKGLPFEVHPVSVSDKEAIRFSGQGKVPIIRDGDRVVFDSWSIATYLERTYPHAPSLFGGPIGENLSQFFNLWADRELIPTLVPYLMLDVLDCVDATDAAHHRTQMETIFKKKLEELSSERAKGLDQFRRRLTMVRKILANTAFLGGEAAAYPDYILFGVLQWSRVVSREQVLAEDDVVASWFERMLDLYDAAGLREPSREQRIKEAAA